MSRLPPFPVDDATLDLLMAAINPRAAGDETAKRSCVGEFLVFMSQMGGSDTDAVEEVIDPGHEVPEGATFMQRLSGAPIHVMRDPQYSEHCVMSALVEEIRRLRAELATR